MSGDVVNVGDLTKPATVLVEKICNAVGVLYEPTRIRRKAKAEADVSRIAALGEMDVRVFQGHLKKSKGHAHG